MAKRKKVERRNLVVLVHIQRKGAGAGYHENRKRRAAQVPRCAKHKVDLRRQASLGRRRVTV